MISARALWRVFVVPLYVVLAGAIFAAAMAQTAGSIIGGLAALAPWAFVFAAGLAMLLVAGGVLRIRRRLRCMRRSIRRQRERRAVARKTSTASTRWAQAPASWGDTTRG